MNQYGIWNNHWNWNWNCKWNKAEGYNARTHVDVAQRRKPFGATANPNQHAQQCKNCQRRARWILHPPNLPPSDMLHPALLKSTEHLVGMKEPSFRHREPINLPEFQVSVSKSLSKMQHTTFSCSLLQRRGKRLDENGSKQLYIHFNRETTIILSGIPMSSFDRSKISCLKLCHKQFPTHQIQSNWEGRWALRRETDLNHSPVSFACDSTALQSLSSV